MKVKNNETKYEKKLWTSNEAGTLPKIFRGDTEYDEANYIVQEINSLRRSEYYKYSDFAVLYRMNSQSRSIEDILRREDIFKIDLYSCGLDGIIKKYLLTIFLYPLLIFFVKTSKE